MNIVLAKLPVLRLPSWLKITGKILIFILNVKYPRNIPPPRDHPVSIVAFVLVD